MQTFQIESGKAARSHSSWIPSTTVDSPAFLQERLRVFDPSGTLYICMRRP